MKHPLTDTYRDGRDRLLALGRTLTEADGETMSTACPDWSIKDLYAHLAGISTDIVNGNTDKAATPEWADRHVAARTERTLADVLDEWAEAGPQVSDVMGSFGDAFPLELFVDQWTHEWDIRAGLGSRATVKPDLAVFDHFFDRFAEIMEADDVGRGLPRLEVDVDGRGFAIGDGDGVGRLSLSLFDFARLSMGRRSQAQIDELTWPMSDRAGHLQVLVRWSIAGNDVIDPVA